MVEIVMKVENISANTQLLDKQEEKQEERGSCKTLREKVFIGE